MPAYSTYKTTGLDWLPQIPAHWEIVRVTRLFEKRSELAVDEDEIVTAFITGQVTLRKNVRAEGLKNAVHFDAWKKVYEGDLAISGMNVHLGGIGISDSNGKMSPMYLIYKPKTNINADYVSLAFRLLATRGYIKSILTTIRYNSADFRHDDVKKLFVPYPPLSEQHAIVSYLDAKGREIAVYIAAKRALVSKLQELKVALIARAVTRGLDTNAKTQASGVEWMGEVPAHWKRLPLKRLVQIKITDGPHETPELIDDGIPFVSAEAIKEGRVNFNFKRGYISPELHAIFCRKCKPQRDDIFMVKSGATTGKLGIIETDEEFSIWSPLALIRAKTKLISARFLYYALQDIGFQRQVQFGWSYGTQQNIGMGVIERLLIAVPPLSEQAAIVSYIEAQSFHIDAARLAAEREIELALELSTTLVAEVVCGARDVRGASLELSDAAQKLWAEIGDAARQSGSGGAEEMERGREEEE